MPFALAENAARRLVICLVVLSCCLLQRSPAQTRRITEPITRGRAELAEEARQRLRTAEAAKKRYLWQAQCLTNVHPYRKVDEVYWDLHLVANAVTAKDPAERPPQIQRWNFFFRCEVLQVVPDGLRVSYSGSSILVVNHPFRQGAYDKLPLAPFAAYEVGTYDYISVAGARLTIRKFDYGIPFDPWQRKRELETGIVSAKPGTASELIDAKARSKRPLPSKRSRGGSGFFITEDGYFVTNFHVVEDAKRVEINTAQGTFPAMVVTSSKESDLAILKANGSFAAIPISTNLPKLGDAVFTIGYPLVDLTGTQPKFADGKVSSLAGLHDDPDSLQISVPVQPGNSGGPLADMAGEVVGIVVARLSDLTTLTLSGAIPQNVNYAVKGSRLVALTKRLPELPAKLVKPAAASDPRQTNAIDRVEKASGLVIVY